MKKVWKNYKGTILLLLGVIIGCILGLIFKEKVTVLKPLGDLYMNIMFVIIVPLIFLTITVSIAKIKEPKRLGKVLITIFLTFLVTSIVSALVGLVVTSSIKLVENKDTLGNDLLLSNKPFYFRGKLLYIQREIPPNPVVRRIL